MFSVIMSFFLVFFLCLILFILSFVVGKMTISDREKASSYECGFEPMGPTRISFSLRFFLVAVIFLVFDLEVVLLFPCVLVSGGVWFFSFMVWVFLFLIGLGLGYEWNEGALDWKE